jgi:hypothetical protein
MAVEGRIRHGFDFFDLESRSGLTMSQFSCPRIQFQRPLNLNGTFLHTESLNSNHLYKDADVQLEVQRGNVPGSLHKSN